MAESVSGGEGTGSVDISTSSSDAGLVELYFDNGTATGNIHVAQF